MKLCLLALAFSTITGPRIPQAPANGRNSLLDPLLQFLTSQGSVRSLVLYRYDTWNEGIGLTNVELHLYFPRFCSISSIVKPQFTVHPFTVHLQLPGLILFSVTRVNVQP